MTSLFILYRITKRPKKISKRPWTCR